jgi:putative inorganic carbon (hco3(-)) transporter
VPVSTALEVIAGIAGTGAASLALLSGDRRLRAAGMLAALALAAVLVLGQAWDDQLTHVRDRPFELAAIVIALAGGLALLAAAFIGWPLLLPLLLITVLPFRIPIDTGNETSYLLIPLYLVIGGGVLAEAAALFRGDAREIGPPSGFARWLAIALAASIVVYAVQAAYSSDVSRAAQNIAFFLIPFTVLFGLLREVEWDSRLLRYALLVVGVEALVLAGIGIVQHEAHHIFWNSKTMESNEFDLNFRVNSLFWDPNIYGRYLALALVLIVGALLWVRDMRRFALGAAAAAVILTGMASSSAPCAGACAGRRSSPVRPCSSRRPSSSPTAAHSRSTRAAGGS